MRFILVPIALCLPACQPDGPFKQIGYFRDDAPNRIFMLHSPEPVSTEEARAEADKQPNTAGRVTQVFLFEGGDPPLDYVTQAADYIAAANALFDRPNPAWRWRLVKTPNGEVWFHDCKEKPDSDNCKPSG